MHFIEELFYKQLNNLITLDKFKPKLAVAVSGGADSMSLLYLTHKWALKQDIEIVALTVNHNLRPESLNEAMLIHSWLKQDNIKHHILTWSRDQDVLNNIQAKAREARYKLLSDWCLEHNFTNLLIGHHLNDQIETFFQRLFRGSGIDGLSCMDFVSNYNKINLYRPLLNIKKKELEDYLKFLGKDWVQDPSNQNIKFSRTIIRKILNSDILNKVTPNKNIFEKRIMQTIKHMQSARDFINLELSKHIKDIVKVEESGYAIIALNKLQNLHQEISKRILIKVLSIVGGKIYKPRLEGLVRITDLIFDNKINQKTMTLNGCQIIIDNDNLLILREIDRTLISQTIDLKKNNTIYWDNKFIIDFNQEIKKQFQIITIEQMGVQNWQKFVNEYQSFKEINLKKNIIFSFLVIKVLDNIIAIPHINYYRFEQLKTLISIKFDPKTFI